MIILAPQKTYENCLNGCVELSYLHDNLVEKTCGICSTLWNIVTCEVIKKENPTTLINEVCDLCNGIVDKKDKFTDKKHCVNCGWF